MLNALNFDNMYLSRTCKRIGRCGLGALSIHYYRNIFQTALRQQAEGVLKRCVLKFIWWGVGALFIAVSTKLTAVIVNMMTDFVKGLFDGLKPRNYLQSWAWYSKSIAVEQRAAIVRDSLHHLKSVTPLVFRKLFCRPRNCIIDDRKQMIPSCRRWKECACWLANRVLSIIIW